HGLAQSGGYGRRRVPSGKQSRAGLIGDVLLAVELSARTCERHIAYLTKDGPFEPRTVELAHDGPGNAGISVRVTPIHFVFVIQSYRNLMGLGWGTTPLQNLLPPIHSDVVVHPSLVDHLELSCIPERVMRFGIFELTLAVNNGTVILGVFGQGAMSPRF